jgi:hypothetical protein
MEKIQEKLQKISSILDEKHRRIVYAAEAEQLGRGGSNGYNRKLWEYELQKFANEYKIEIFVCHFPPGTSKWNKIEH